MNETGYAFNLNKGKSTDGAIIVRIVVLQLVLKKMNASRPSEHLSVRGENVKRLGRIIGCKYKTSD